MDPTTSFEIERIRWMLDNGYPQYALCRTLRLIARNWASVVSEKRLRLGFYFWMYRKHVLFEYGFRDQVIIVWDFIRRSRRS